MFNYLNRKNGELIQFSNEIDVGRNVDVNGITYQFVQTGSLLIDVQEGNVFQYVPVEEDDIAAILMLLKR